MTGSDQDPFGVTRLLEASAKAIESARTPAEAVNRLADAIDAERGAYTEHNAQLNRLLREWTRNLRLIAPVLPDTEAGDLPALGPYPRRQDLIRELSAHLDRYQQALAGHLSALTDLFEECTEAYRETLEPLNDPDPDSLLTLWSQIAEPRYEHWLSQPDTQARMGELINAWSALSATIKALVDELLEGLGLPSSRGVDDLAAELQRQRRRQRQEIGELRAEITALRDALDTITAKKPAGH